MTKPKKALFVVLAVVVVPALLAVLNIVAMLLDLIELVTGAGDE